MTIDLTFLKVYDIQGSAIRVMLTDEPMIDAAVEQYVSSNRTHDTLLLLTLAAGGTYTTLASAIVSWLASTPELRATERAYQRELDREVESETWSTDG